MSNFNCEKCGTAILDTGSGYITSCKHYPQELTVTVTNPKDRIALAREWYDAKAKEKYGSDSVMSGGGDYRLKFSDMADYADDRTIALTEENEALKVEVERLLNERDRYYIQRNLYFRWAYQFLLALAKRHLAQMNAEREDPKNWPAGQEWYECNSSSHSIFLRAARAEADVPDDEFLEVVRSGVIDVDDLYENSCKSLGEKS